MHCRALQLAGMLYIFARFHFSEDLLVFFMVCGVALFGSCTSGNAEWPPAAYKRVVECIPKGKPPTPSVPYNVAFCLALKVLRNILHTL